MKKFTFISLVAFLMACSQKPESGSSDFSSLDQDVSYHNQTESLTLDKAFSYTRVDMKANGDFAQSEAVWDDETGVGTKCSLTGTWAIPVPDAHSAEGNELVATITHVNGVALGTPVEKRYDLREVSYESLKWKPETVEDDADLVDMTNINYATYPEYDALDTGALAPDTFCDR
ncbi:hypothetical protein QJS83_13120 [Bdellovibrio sp. 22V]|uniref:hypothetical protein n=1 Tax=Bdellovibrio sp. 22V TaxID=3044166 RepID=UPI002543A029|nr:hypothetical protein [Bdellovibrio sp. 22V]WII71404.1 hypothetical protein QJS83_13120 [Bdellovibrio sp. 22V]